MNGAPQGSSNQRPARRTRGRPAGRPRPRPSIARIATARRHRKLLHLFHLSGCWHERSGPGSPEVVMGAGCLPAVSRMAGRRAAGMTYRFDDVEVDAAGFRVTKAGEPVRLEPKALELLLFLARNPGPPRDQGRDPGVRLEGHRGHRERPHAPRGPDPQGPRGRRARGPLHRNGADEGLPLRGDPRETGAESPAPTGGTGSSPAAAPRWRPGLRAAAGATALLALTLVGLAAATLDRTPPGRRRPVGSPLTARSSTQVSTRATLNVFPRFSPDGSVDRVRHPAQRLDGDRRARARPRREGDGGHQRRHAERPAHALAGRPADRLSLRRARRDLARARPRRESPAS